MIFVKWSTDWVATAKNPPSLLNTLISMFMAPGVYTEEDRLFPEQEKCRRVFRKWPLRKEPNGPPRGACAERRGANIGGRRGHVVLP